MKNFLIILSCTLLDLITPMGCRGNDDYDNNRNDRNDIVVEDTVQTPAE